MSADEHLIAKIVDVLNGLPTTIASTPYGKLPANLAKSVEWFDTFCAPMMERVRTREVAPKPAGLFELRNAVQELQRKLKKVPEGHRRLVVGQMHHAAVMRGKAYWPIAKGIAKLERPALAALVEIMEDALTTLCNEPNKDVPTEKQITTDIRYAVVRSIKKAFEGSGRKLNKNQMTTVAKALASVFPPEACLASLNPSTVRDILRAE